MAGNDPFLQGMSRRIRYDAPAFIDAADAYQPDGSDEALAQHRRRGELGQGGSDLVGNILNGLIGSLFHEREQQMPLSAGKREEIGLEHTNREQEQAAHWAAQAAERKAADATDLAQTDLAGEKRYPAIQKYEGFLKQASAGWKDARNAEEALAVAAAVHGEAAKDPHVGPQLASVLLEPYNKLLHDWRAPPQIRNRLKQIQGYAPE